MINQKSGGAHCPNTKELSKIVITSTPIAGEGVFYDIVKEALKPAPVKKVAKKKAPAKKVAAKKTAKKKGKK